MIDRWSKPPFDRCSLSIYHKGVKQRVLERRLGWLTPFPTHFCYLLDMSLEISKPVKDGVANWRKLYKFIYLLFYYFNIYLFIACISSTQPNSNLLYLFICVFWFFIPDRSYFSYWNRRTVNSALDREQWRQRVVGVILLVIKNVNTEKRPLLFYFTLFYLSLYF